MESIYQSVKFDACKYDIFWFITCRQIRPIPWPQHLKRKPNPKYRIMRSEKKLHITTNHNIIFHHPSHTPSHTPRPQITTAYPSNHKILTWLTVCSEEGRVRWEGNGSREGRVPCSCHAPRKCVWCLRTVVEERSEGCY